MGEGEDSLARGTPRKATTGQNLQQLDEVPRSLGGRSRKAKKVARIGTSIKLLITYTCNIGVLTESRY